MRGSGHAVEAHHAVEVAIELAKCRECLWSRPCAKHVRLAESVKPFGSPDVEPQ